MNLSIVIPTPTSAHGASFSLFFEGTSASDGNLIITMGGTNLAVGTIRGKYPNNTVVNMTITDDFTLTGAQLGSSVEFFSSGGNWFVNGSVEYITLYEEVTVPYEPIVFESNTYTVLVANSGKIHNVPSNGGSIGNIIMPAVVDADGAVFKFVFMEAATAKTHITCPAGTFKGSARFRGVSTVINGSTTIEVPVLVTAGSTIELVCDGESYFDTPDLNTRSMSVVTTITDPTWVPQITGTTGGALAITYPYCSYYLIEDVITVNLRINWTSIVGVSGNIVISLPFNPDITRYPIAPNFTIGYVTGINYTGVLTSHGDDAGVAGISLFNCVSGAGPNTQITAADLESSGEIRISGTYVK